MALKGILTKDGCMDVFQLLGRQNKIGVLKLRSGTEAPDIFLHLGLVVRVENKTRHGRDRLGEMLVRAGLLSRPALQEALAVQRSSGKRMGHVLLERRMVAQNLLIDFIRLQSRETLFNAFLLRGGTYEFVSGVTCTTAPELAPGIRWEHAVMEGARRADEWPRIREVIPSNDHSFEVVKELSEPPSKPAAAAQDDSFFGDLGEDLGGAESDFPGENERLVYALVRPGASLQRIVDQSYLGEFETAKALWRLCTAGYLRARLDVEEIDEADAELVLDDAHAPRR